MESRQATVTEAQNAGTLTLPDGTTVPYRAIQPEDAPALQAFHRSLSEQSVYLRFFGFMRELSDERARYFTQLDGVNRVALVALDPVAPGTIIGVVRYDRDAGTDEAEYAAVVTDRWQGRGLGTALTQRLIVAARRCGITRLYAVVLPGNERMLHLLRDLHLLATRAWLTEHIPQGIGRVSYRRRRKLQRTSHIGGCACCAFVTPRPLQSEEIV
jgi:RimJ/RimL family protein N-acetyltransferase